MTETARGTFRVVDVYDDSIHVHDIDRNYAVLIERFSDDYGKTLQNQIDSIKPGHKVHIDLRGGYTDKDHPMGDIQEERWYADAVIIEDKTRIHMNDDILIISKAKSLINKVHRTDASIARADIMQDDSQIGHITVFKTGLEPDRPVLETDIEERLQTLGKPPYEIFLTTYRDDFVVQYYFTDPSLPIVDTLKKTFCED